jgi:hypothetical protein
VAVVFMSVCLKVCHEVIMKSSYNGIGPVMFAR